MSQNFRAEVSLAACIDHARGDAIINVFSDLQDPPELIPQIIAESEDGYDVVYGVIQQRRDYSWMKRLSSRIAYACAINLKRLPQTRKIETIEKVAVSPS